VVDGRTNVIFRLYYAPGTYALATHISLEEAGALRDGSRRFPFPKAQGTPNTSRSTRKAGG
jgi:hypothetical protein